MKNLRKQRLEHLALWLESLQQIEGLKIHWGTKHSLVWFTYSNAIHYDDGFNRTLLGVTGAICQMFKPFTRQDMLMGNYIPTDKVRQRAKRLLGMDESEFCRFIQYATASYGPPSEYAKGIRAYMRTCK